MDFTHCMHWLVKKAYCERENLALCMRGTAPMIIFITRDIDLYLEKEGVEKGAP